MPIDPSIAMGVRPVQAPNMLANYAQAQELGVNQLKMQEAQQSIEDRNFMRGLDPSSPEYINKIASRNPELAVKLQKGRMEARTAELDQRTKIGTLLKASATPVIANPTFENAVMALQSFSKATGDDVTAEFNTLQKIGNNPEAIKKWAMGHAMSGDQILAQTDLNANQAAQLGLTKRGQDLTYAAATQPVFSESAGGFFTRPTGGKEATFVEPTGMGNTKKGKEIEKGKNLVSDVATQMGDSYLKLQQAGGIKSTQKGAAANVAAGAQSSMLGQLGGAALGTPEQSERDFIKSQRPLLVQAIVKATGMSATQINSNVELKNLLDAATDPGKGYETNAKSLNLINKRFGTGADVIPVNTGGGSNIDALLEKYK